MVTTNRLVNAERNTDHDCKEQCQATQVGTLWNVHRQQRPHLLVEFVGVTEITVQKMVNVQQVLHRKRTVVAVRDVKVSNRARRRAHAKIGASDSARQEMQ